MNTQLFPTITDFRVPKKDPPMKKLLSFLLLGAAKLTASEDLAILKAISAIESGWNPKAVGAAGERGLYQLSKNTWEQTTDLPFSDAFDPIKSQMVALKHLRWLRAQLQKCKTNVQPVDLAYGWKCGYSFCLPNRRSVESNESLMARLEYGARFQNLFSEYNKPQ